MVHAADDRRSHAAIAAWIAGFAAVYALSKALLGGAPGLVAFWPASGVLLAGALLLPRRERGIFLGGAAVVHTALATAFGHPLPVAAAFALTNVVQTLVGARLTDRWAGPDADLSSVRQVFRFTLLAAPAASALGAGFAFLVALATSEAPHAGDPVAIASTWFTATLAGAVAVVPVALTRRLGPTVPALRDPAKERSALVVGLVAVSLVAFGQPWIFGSEIVHLRYAPLPLLVWAALRLGPAGTSAACLFVVVSAMGLQRRAPGVEPHDLQWLLAFLFTTTVTAQVLAAATAERRAAEARLAERTEQLASVIDAAQIGVWVVEPARGRIRFDDGWRRMLGYPSEVEEMALTEAMDLLHPDDREPSAARWERFRTSDRDAIEEVVRVRQADGTWRVVLSRGCAQRAADGAIVRIVGTNTDVTELRRATESLRVAEARFRAAAEGGLDAFCLLSSARDGGGEIEDFTFAYLNRNGAWMLGRRLEDVIGRRLGDIVPEFRRNGFVRRLGKAAAAGRMLSEELRLDAPGIRSGHLQAQAVPTHDGIAVMLRDVTEQRRLERDLRQAQKMEGIGRLAGGVAHDFNNLLTVIRGYCEMARGHVPPGGGALAMIDEALVAADRASDLTGRLLTFARRQKVEMRRVDVAVLVRGVEKMLRRVIGEDIQLEFRAPDGGAWTVVEPGGLEQTVLNLALNARDAMPRGGRLAVTVAEVHLTEQQACAHADARPGRFVRVEVADTGTGMEPDVVAHLFEPFFTTKPQGRGTGLGLAICYGVVKQASGFITVESSPGRGTRFGVHLPVAEPAPVEAACAAPTAPPAGGETVLVVEDEPAVRRILVEGLRLAGYRVLEAADGNAALAASRRHDGPIDLVVTDVVMPGFKGPEVAALLRAERPGTRVIFVSGYTAEAFSSDGEEAAVLRKPFTLVALQAKVREVLDAAGATA